ncbi:MADS-box transcription factor 27 [Bienertia sinuspersici]
MGTRSIRSRKEILVHQENMELHKKINLMRQEMTDLQKKVELTDANLAIKVHGGSGKDDNEGGGGGGASSSTSAYDTYDSIELKLS